ncbi:ketopantoate reductase family protein [Streptomyces sp. TP-A0874]|uniref:ketopantoate reductase family protein n=1 Tax=Streptomyces sp. TP-A0874 TaxID=549819 RepID=UPI0009A0435C|nr:2-dehydropantoate 2-reductase [Streptomyces sp. TP-A0874]
MTAAGANSASPAEREPAARPATVAVLGPGGVGGLVGALLARAGHRVICLAGTATADALRRDGLTVSSAQYGDFTVPVEADTELREQVDVCFVTVKQTALADALERIPAGALGGGLVVPLLNGVEHVAVLREHFPPERVIAATITVESTRVAPGRIEHGGLHPAIRMAPLRSPDPAVDRLTGLLAEAGLKAATAADETETLWGKLCFLAPMALLTTRYGLTAGGARTERRAELHAVIAEVTAVARAAGAPVTAEDIQQRFDAAPPTMKSSMLRDAEAGRPLELDAIGGAVLRAAEALGVAAPVTRRIVTELRAR